MYRTLFVLVVLVGVVVCHDFQHLEPLIEVFRPRGLRVSIPDSAGVREFTFHGLVDANMFYGRRNLVLHTNRTEGPLDRWVVRHEEVTLMEGEVLNYYFSIRRDRTGYQSGHGQFVVPDNLPRFSSRDFNIFNPGDFKNETSVANTSETIHNLQAEIESLRVNNTRLSQLIETCVGPNKIILSGLIPHSDDSKEVVKFILNEVLHLQSNVTVAVKRSDGTIEFEVPTLFEKVAILYTADTKLNNSTIKFTNTI